MSAGKAKMSVVHMEIERLLNKIYGVLPVEYKLTLVARNTSMSGADILMTADDLDKVIAVIEDLRTGNVHESPGAN